MYSEADGPQINVYAKGGPRRQRFRFTLAVDGHIRRWTRTAIRDKRPGTPRRRYWEGTDAFWNYCVRGRRDIKQSDGLRYCDRPGRPNGYSVTWRY